MINILLIAYSSFACLALAMPRHYQLVFKKPVTAYWQLSFRLAGWMLCLLSLWLCLSQAISWSIGLVEWLGCLTGAAVIFIFLLPYLPRMAAILAGVTLIFGFVHTLFL